MSAKISNKACKNVYKRGHYRCALCDSEKAIQIHHVIPRSLGGDNTEKNLITLCVYCHGELHGTHFPEHLEWMDAEYTEPGWEDVLQDESDSPQDARSLPEPA